MELPMNEQWQYQLRVYLTDDLSDVARSDRNNPALRPLTDILDKHHATLLNQFDAFASYVVEAGDCARPLRALGDTYDERGSEEDDRANRACRRH
jgi:hypothetical protein